jgi:hypothetical protein
MWGIHSGEKVKFLWLKMFYSCVCERDSGGMQKKIEESNRGRAIAQSREREGQKDCER